MKRTVEAPRELLPLKAEVFEILLRLARGECHGYAIMQDVAEATGGAIDMLPGTLYRHLRWMLERDLIAEIGHRDLSDGRDQRRRVYRITDRGRSAAELEAARLAERVAAARASHLLPRTRTR